MVARYKTVLMTLLVNMSLVAMSGIVVGESPWPMYKGNPQRNSQSDYPGPSINPIVEWVYGEESDWQVGWPPDNNPVYFSPIIDSNGIVYNSVIAPQTKQGILVLNPDGSKKQFEAGIGYSYLAIQPDGSILPDFDTDKAKAEDGTVYYGRGNILYAFDGNGSQKWERVFEGDSTTPLVLAPAIGKDGIIYVVVRGVNGSAFNWRDYLYAISPENEIIWDVSVGGYGSSSPVVSASGTVYVFATVFSWDIGCLQLVAADDGQIKWSKLLTCGNFTFHSLPVVDSQENIYFSIFGTIYCYDNNGAELWSLSPTTPSYWGYTDLTLALSNDGTLYVAGIGAIVAIGPAESALPDASFTYSPSLDKFLSGQEITFTASQDETIVSYEWNFKHGTTEIGTDEGPVVYHRFSGIPNEATSYTIILTVRGTTGRVGTDEKVITVTHLEKKAEVIVDDILGSGLSRIGAKVSYNWFDYENGEDVFKISRIDSWSNYFVGVYVVSVENESGILWEKPKKDLPAIPLYRTYYPEDLYVHASDWLRVTAYGVTEKEMLGLVSIASGVVELPTMPPGDVPFFNGSDTLYFAPDYIDTSDFPVIDVEDTEVLPFLMGRLCSPGELRVCDSQGRVTGLINGEVKEEIPDSVYFNGNFVIPFPSEPYHYEIVGINAGTYGLGVISVGEANAIIFKAADIPTSPDITHRYTVDWAALSQSQDGVTLEIDVNGIPDRVVISDNVLRACEVAVRPLGYELISQKRLNRTEFEYTFRLRAVNTWKCGFKDVTLQLVRVPDNTIILDDTVRFPLIEPEKEVISDDTFTIKADRTITGQDSEILWQVCDCTQPKKSDFNCDWNIDVADLAVFAEAWLVSGNDMLPDIFPDHRVDFIDFAFFAEEWFK